VTLERRPELRIVNPNADVRVTRWLSEEARRVAGDRFDVMGVNAESRLPAIQTPRDIEVAARAVVAAIAAPPRPFGAIVAAFGDPGLQQARALGSPPVVGLGECGLMAAAKDGRRFSIVTLGAAMRETIIAKTASLGLRTRVVDVCILPFSIAQMTEDRETRRSSIAAAIRACAHEGAEAVLLGGAPFAGLAASLAIATGWVVLDGVEASVRRLVSMAGSADR